MFTKVKFASLHNLDNCFIAKLQTTESFCRKSSEIPRKSSEIPCKDLLN